MNRYDQYGPLDDQPKPLGDRGFIGVNMRLDPAQLPPGYVSEAINMRFRQGVAETRKGFTILPWTNKIVAGETQPWGTVHGTGVFSDPFTLQEYLVIAADGAAWYTQAGNTPQTLTLGGGVTITQNVSFTQAFDVMIMHRGTAADTLQMPRISQGFALVEQTPSGNGTHAIPNADHSLFLQNRLLIPNDNDEIAASDLNDYTRYVPVAQEFKINQGSADKLVAAFKFNDTTIIAFKEHSIYAVSNVFGDLSELQQDELTNQFGLVARKSIAHVGRDLWFLSELGVMSITQTEQNKLQGVVLPVSDPIQPLIERINWRYAHNAVAAVWDSKYYLAVPLDDAEVLGPDLLNTTVHSPGSVQIPVVVGKTYRWEKGDHEVSLSDGTTTLTASGDITPVASPLTMLGDFDNISASLRQVDKGVNNAVFVYDFLNGAWAGHDEAPGFAVRDWQLFTYNGTRRLFAITPQGYIALYEEDFEDQLTTPYTDVKVNVPPAIGNTIQVNGGAVITANGATDNSATTWAGQWADPVPLYARENLFVHDSSTYGYSPLLGNPWSAPNTLVTVLRGTDPAFAATVPDPEDTVYDLGVRFYATNGVIPSVVTTGSWATVTENGVQPITATLTTRGYGSDVNALADYNWLVCDVQTWAPEFTIELISAGVNEVLVAADAVTKSRTAYYEPSDAAAFEQDNDNGDFLTPFREDYSVLLGDATGAAADFAVHTITDGVPIHLHQEHRLTERINAKGRTAQVRITNAQGRIRVMAVALEAEEKEIYAGSKA